MVASQYRSFEAVVECQYEGAFIILGRVPLLRNQATFSARNPLWQKYIFEITDAYYVWPWPGQYTMRVTIAARGPFGRDLLAGHEGLYEWLEYVDSYESSSHDDSELDNILEGLGWPEFPFDEPENNNPE